MPVVEVIYPYYLPEKDVLPGTADITKYGPLIPVTISNFDDGRRRTKEVALIDTGATHTCIDESICRKLNLVTPCDEVELGGIGGREMRPCYSINIDFMHPDLPLFPVISAVSARLEHTSKGEVPIAALIGRDLLKYFRLTYDGAKGYIELSTNPRTKANELLY